MLAGRVSAKPSGLSALSAIQWKIRQQLQVLRDRGLLTQPKRGLWQRV